MQDKPRARHVAGLIIAATSGAVVLMLHHPTSLDGPDDGRLLSDWTNAGVHGGMIVCLLALGLGVSSWARGLEWRHLSVRAGAMAFDSGMTAFVAAALINGFALDGLAPIQRAGLGALNHTLAGFGLILTAAALAFWSMRMLRRRGLTRITGVLGLAAAVLALVWTTVGGGVFGLHQATFAVVVLALWSFLIAAAMLREQPAGDTS